MINILGGSINLRKDYLIECIQEELDTINFLAKISDDKNSRDIWNLYGAFDRRSYNKDNNKPPVTNEFYCDGFHYYALLEYIKDGTLFGHKKFWFILKVHNFYPLDPYFEEYNGDKVWDSETTTESEIIDIIKILDKQVDGYYEAEYQSYREESEREYLAEMYGPDKSSVSDKEDQFNNMMDDFEAWGNIE